MWVKFRNFLVQFFFLFISFIINMMVLAPVWIVMSGIFGEATSEPVGIASGLSVGGLFMSILTPFLGFGLNEVFLRLKGKKTAEYYEVSRLHVSGDVRETWSGYRVDVSSYTTTEVEKSLTIWGILARILAVIAFPLRVVAFIASYIALFCPALYSTFGRVDPNMPQVFGSKVTHLLFDFVIVPVHGHASRHMSPMCILWIVVYIVVGVLFAAGETLAAMYAVSRSPGVVIIPLLLIWFFCTLSTLILAIKYSIVICFSCYTKVAIVYLLRVMMLPVIVTVLSVIIYFLPWASWGFAVL